MSKDVAVLLGTGSGLARASRPAGDSSQRVLRHAVRPVRKGDIL